MDRWIDERPQIPLSALGVDIARGGPDKTVLAKRYGNWIGPLVKMVGRETPDGASVAALVIREDDAAASINMDVIGVGGSGYDHTKAIKSTTVAMNGAERDDSKRDRSGQLRFRNKRAEWHWRMREALEPGVGDELMLPPDRELRADLIAPRWHVSPLGIQIETKKRSKRAWGDRLIAGKR